MIYNNVVLTVNDDASVATVLALLGQFAERSRGEPGCAGFDVFHSQSERRWFLLVEKWDSQEVLDRHRQASAFRELYQPLVLPLVLRTPHPCDLVSTATESR